MLLMRNESSSPHTHMFIHISHTRTHSSLMPFYLFIYSPWLLFRWNHEYGCAASGSLPLQIRCFMGCQHTGNWKWRRTCMLACSHTLFHKPQAHAIILYLFLILFLVWNFKKKARIIQTLPILQVLRFIFGYELLIAIDMCTYLHCLAFL